MMDSIGVLPDPLERECFNSCHTLGFEEHILSVTRYTYP